ncbi:BlaI/MecI/CopY family transcriptional regulator [Pseudonocardia sp. KRD291]|uniref:BlaI/MecI/CopY family transcriptional regulator n=1 Tax=Pseudonocardia sp. KRD291 TaxID=2792007 RepID=UPI001C4A1BCB|nr:BlaI/MecI/CopY family transcriptional regulator [Pseudonocardia sp. KRD291]MBW0104173.1 BlaI/MecI/CopY family transcriptional regulator [Pseudonocardia sp. KRD291]
MVGDSPAGHSSLGLGQLEHAVLEVLWDSAEPRLVREVLSALSPHRTLAYTTVQTVLEKLTRKGWAQRRRAGRGFAYTAISSREQTAAQLMHSLLRSSAEVDTALLHFIGFASGREQEVLRQALNGATSPSTDDHDD